MSSNVIMGRTLRPRRSSGLGGTAEVLAAAASFAPCVVDLAVSGSGSAARCAWSKIKAIIEARSDVEAMFETVANSDCRTVLRALGVPSEAASVACALGGSVWTRVQNLAADELLIIYRRRGRERPAAEGGGRTLVDAAGVTVAVECPLTLDGDGRPVLMEPSAACPPPGRTDATDLPRAMSVVEAVQGGMMTRGAYYRPTPPPAPPVAAGTSAATVVGGIGALGLLGLLAYAVWG